MTGKFLKYLDWQGNPETSPFLQQTVTADDLDHQVSNMFLDEFNHTANGDADENEQSNNLAADFYMLLGHANSGPTTV